MAVTFDTKNMQMIVASMVNWMANNQSIVTDFNRGAVVRTELESVSLEMEEFYYRVFAALGPTITDAIFSAFEFPRLPAVRATGRMRFSRTSPALTDINIPVGTVVRTSDSQPKRYTTSSQNVVIYGRADMLVDSFATVGPESHIVLKATEGDKSPRFMAGENVTIAGGANDGLTFVVVSATYSSPNTILVVTGAGFTPEPASTATLTVLGRTEAVDVDVTAEDVGSPYNVDTGTVNILDSIITGVESVINTTPMSGGTDNETDASRRARFSLFIQSLARGTLPSLEFAALNVPAIVTARAVDSQPVYVVVLKRGENYPGTGVETDYSDLVNFPYALSFDLMQAVGPGNGSSLIVGAEIQFDRLYLDISRPGTQAPGATGPTGEWQYYASGISDFAAMPGGAVVSDGTNGLTQGGVLVLDLAALNNPLNPNGVWDITSLEAGSGSAWHHSMFPIRFRETDVVGDQFDVLPQGVQIFVSPMPGTAIVFASEANAVLTADVKAKVEQAILGYLDSVSHLWRLGYRAAGIRVSVQEPVLRHVPVTCRIRVNPSYDATSVMAHVATGLTAFTSAFTLGRSIYVPELIQYVMNLHDDAIDSAKIDVPTDDVLAAPNQLLTITSADVTVNLE